MLGEQPRQVLMLALMMGAALTMLKLIVATSTASTAVMAEGLHSLAATAHQVLLAGVLTGTASPAARDGHPGHVGFWAYVVAVLVYPLAAGIAIYGGMDAIEDGWALGDPFAAALVLGGPIPLHLVVLSKAKAFAASAEASSTDRAVLGVVRAETTVAIAGLVVALAGYAVAYTLDWPAADAAAAVAVGLLMGFVAARMALRTRALLAGSDVPLPATAAPRAAVVQTPAPPAPRMTSPVETIGGAQVVSPASLAAVTTSVAGAIETPPAARTSPFQSEPGKAR